jgi:hypothetical protein
VTLISDPTFYLAAIPAVTFLGVSKGGFSGVGLLATPLLALVLPPLQAAAILLPILILQDLISVLVYRQHWDARNLKVMRDPSAFRTFNQFRKCLPFKPVRVLPLPDHMTAADE